MFDYLRVFPAFQTNPNLPTMHEGTNQKLWGYIYIYGTISTINNCDSVETVAKHDWIMVQPMRIPPMAAMSVSKAHGEYGWAIASHCKPCKDCGLAMFAKSVGMIIPHIWKK